MTCGEDQKATDVTDPQTTFKKLLLDGEDSEVIGGITCVECRDEDVGGVKNQ